jgi:tRNA (cytidine32/uridine32-2'-O)-methyltransferase
VTELLERVGIVLVETRDPLNIGGALRATRNMGVRDLRLVAPLSRDPARVAVTAPGLEAEAAALPVFATLEEAVADGVLVLGFSARGRRARHDVWSVEELPGRLAERLPAGGPGRAYLVFGREDFGLSNADLERCHALVTIPTAPEHASMNLAQAVLLGAWTLRQAAAAPALDTASPVRAPATAEAVEGLLEEALGALRHIEFFKYAGAEAGVRRALAGVFARARLDEREVRLLRGMFAEVVAFFSRRGSG